MLKDRLTSAASKKGMEILTWGLIGVVIIIIATILTKVFKAAKAGSVTAGDIAGGAIITQQTGIQANRQEVCKQVAIDAEDVIYRIPLVNTIAWISDDSLILALNRLLTGPEAALCSQFFKQNGGGSLKAAVEGWWMTESSRERINPIIRQNLT